jgi:DNA invertase Pin-like site-specific DNA recombinase
MKTKRAAIYLRCSTKSQETEMQEVDLVEYASRRGWEYKIYRDAGYSGAKESRPALDSLLSDVRKRKVDVLVCWALDRLARSLKQLLTIAEECRSLDVDFVSLKQNVDTTLPAGRLTFQVLGAVAEFEREMLRTRVKAGLEMARRNGKRLGRPALRRFDSYEVSEIRRLRKSGTSVRSLAVRYGTTQYLISKMSEAGA